MKLKELFTRNKDKDRKKKEKEENRANRERKEQKNDQSRNQELKNKNQDTTEVDVKPEDKPQKEKSREERIKLKEHTLGFPSEVDGTEVDVILEVPEVKVDKIRINVEDIDARVDLHVEALDLVHIDAGVHVHLDQVEVIIKGVRAEAYLQVRLERVKSVLTRVMEMLDNNADMITDLLKPIGEGAGKAAGQIGEGAGDAAGSAGEGAKDTLSGVGKGTKEAAS